MTTRWTGRRARLLLLAAMLALWAVVLLATWRPDGQGGTLRAAPAASAPHPAASMPTRPEHPQVR